MTIGPHWFWWTLTAACLAWYCTITVYVAIRGVADIRQMLRRLDALAAEDSAPAPANPRPPTEAG